MTLMSIKDIKELSLVQQNTLSLINLHGSR